MAYEKPLMREATGMAAEACDIEGLYRAHQGADRDSPDRKQQPRMITIP